MIKLQISLSKTLFIVKEILPLLVYLNELSKILFIISFILVLSPNKLDGVLSETEYLNTTFSLLYFLVFSFISFSTASLIS